MESSVDKSKCFNLTWKIESFGMCFLERDICLEAPIFKTETATENTWWQLYVKPNELNNSEFKLFLSRIIGKPDKYLKNQKFQLSVDYHFGEIMCNDHLLDFNNNSYVFTVKKNAIVKENTSCRDLEVSKDTLTVHCKIWYETIKPEDRLIRTMLKKVNIDFEFNISSLPDPQVSQSVLFNSACPIYMYENDNIQLTINVQRYFLDNPRNFQLFVERQTNSRFFFIKCTLSSNSYDITSDIITQSFGIWTCKAKNYYATHDILYKLVLKCIVGVEMTSFQVFPLTLPPKFSSPSAISSSAKHLNGISNSKDVAISCKKLSDDFLHFYQEGKLSDATLNTVGKAFPVHRSILAARSSVFHAMFEKDEMSESKSGVVDIDDVDSETVDRMLVFLYGDKLGNVNWDQASALYYAADKYDVQPLKQNSAKIMKASLTVENACDALVMADRHSDEELMKCTVDFIKSHQEVLSSTEWDKLEQNDLRLAANIMREIFVKRVDKTNF